MEKVPITREGYENLKKELDHILKVDRPTTVKAIETARAHGDLSENAEYHAAKEKQGFLESRIIELNTQIGQSEIVQVDQEYDRCVFGANVTLEVISTGEQNCYVLVGPYESAPEEGRVSVTSPLGQALIGKEEGDEIRFKSPGGVQEIEIIEIK